MPNIKSAKKKARQSVKRYERNRAEKSFMKSLKKKTLTVLLGEAVKPTAAQEAVDFYKSQVDKAWAKGLFKRNKSSRLKSNIDLLYYKKFISSTSTVNKQ